MSRLANWRTIQVSVFNYDRWTRACAPFIVYSAIDAGQAPTLYIVSVDGSRNWWWLILVCVVRQTVPGLCTFIHQHHPTAQFCSVRFFSDVQLQNLTINQNREKRRSRSTFSMKELEMPSSERFISHPGQQSEMSTM